MAKIPATVAALCLVAAVACLLPSPASAARDLSKPQFIVEGRVFCDTCQAGYETSASTYIAGAKVRVECRARATGSKTCSYEGVTNEDGAYSIKVTDDHEYEICESVLVSSPDKGCATALLGREKAPVFLTSNNGIASNTRYANALGFTKDSPLALCTELLKQYQLDD